MSCVKDTCVKIIAKDFCYNGPIGEFIDNLLDKHNDNMVEIGKDSVVLDLMDDYKIIGVSNDEKTSWMRISQVSRHPANGGLVKVTTQSGKTTTATLSHSFLKRTEKGIEPILGSELKEGMRIPIAKSIPESEDAMLFKTIGEFGEVPLSRDFGWLCGAYLADGCVTTSSVNIAKIIPEYRNKIKEVVKMIFKLNVNYRESEATGAFGDNYEDKTYKQGTSLFNNSTLATFFGNDFGKLADKKCIPAWVFAANAEFISGLIGGYFDGDGSANAIEGKQMIRSGSISEKLTNDIIQLLAYKNIFASKSQEFPSRLGKNMLYTVQISRKYASAFKEKIGFIVKDKADKIIEYVHKAPTRVSEKEMIPKLGNIIGYIGERLALPGQSRLYKRWMKKEAVGRNTLIKYIELFESENTEKNYKDVEEKINLLKQAAFSDVVWDKIVKLEYLDDPQEYVYDFTVPGNDSFMVDTGVLVHNTLNTFHLSGVSSASRAVRGIPRIKELLSVTRNIKAPSMTIKLKEPYKTEKMKAKEVLYTIQTTYFADIVKSTKIYYDPDDFNTTIENDKFFLKTYKEFIKELKIDVENLSPWLLRLEFDKDKMLEYEITMIDVYNALQEFYEDSISVMYSDDNADKLVFRIKISETEDKNDIITDLKALEKNILENLVVKGIRKVSKVIMNKTEGLKYNKDTMGFEKSSEWVLETSGTNLIEILSHKCVDAIRTVSNDINEIYETFGIEAARQHLYNEIYDVIHHADLYVNYRHLALLVDTMTNKGYLLSIDRHGINRVDIGPLAKSSFEETNDMIIKAGVFSELDRINGVSGNIMVGACPPCGTGDTDILIDEDKLPSLYVKEKEAEVTRDDMCQNISVDYSLPSTSKATKRKKQTLKIK